MSIDIEDVPCASCVKSYSTSPHECDAPDYCPCDGPSQHTNDETAARQKKREHLEAELSRLETEKFMRLKGESKHRYTYPASSELLTAGERMVVAQAAQLWNAICATIPDGPTRDADLRELIVHVHAIQHAFMSNAAARAYPDTFRLLGSTLAKDGA